MHTSVNDRVERQESGDAVQEHVKSSPERAFPNAGATKRLQKTRNPPVLKRALTLLPSLVRPSAAFQKQKHMKVKIWDAQGKGGAQGCLPRQPRHTTPLCVSDVIACRRFAQHCMYIKHQSANATVLDRTCQAAQPRIFHRHHLFVPRQTNVGVGSA